jgi:hypothetical protein
METQTEVVDEEATGYIAELNKDGDTKYTWNRKNPAECEAAKDHFNRLLKKGFLAFKVKSTGDKGAKVDEFNPKAGKYIYTPPKLTKDFDPKASYVVSPPMTGG